MNTELRGALERVADRYRGVRLWGSVALCWLGLALVGFGQAAYLAAARPEDGWIPVPIALSGLLTAGGAWFGIAAWARRSARDHRWVARRIEARYPDLGTGLLAAIEETAAPDRRPGYLQDAVVREALRHRRGHDWEAVVPAWKLVGSRLAAAASLALLVASTVALGGHVRSKSLGDPPPVLVAASAAEVRVEPGNASIEKGTSLLVVARFLGAVPADARLAVIGSAPLPMARSLEDPTFAGRVESVAADLAYRVEFGRESTETFRVTVFEYPEVRRTDARLVFPAYTAIEPKVVEDIRHVTAVEGTELTLTCRLNKEVAEAALVDEQGQATTLVPAKNEANAHAATFTLADSHRYKVKLVDREGRSSKVPAEVAVHVTRNRPAAVTMTRPGRDTRVSPVEELTLQAKLEDDFGVVRHGLSYTLAGKEPTEVPLAIPRPGTKAVQAEHVLAFEALKARPDQLVTYFFWAEDVGPDGKPRRSSGDMFFAEVRHFEEIFRQGEPPPSSSSEQPPGGLAQQAEKLAELQKQVINATWTLIRRETSAHPTAAFAADARALREAQHSAIEQAEPLAAKLQDPASKADLARATGAMKDAENRLAEAAGKPSIASLAPALASEQAAYQALLKLRAREFEVSRRNPRQPQGGGQSGGASQEQLDQLQLSDEENRYEQQTTAKAATQKEQAGHETRQVLNRLGELARRQADLNDRLKELQSALEAAKEPKAREEIDRQLKRLRDQQQQILRDADDLRERMEREENRDRMAESRQQLERSREHVRQASEALEKGQVPRAVTEGARAGRELNDLRDDLRKKSSDRFSEEMTEIRDQARRLDQTQGELTGQLENRDRQPSKPTLRDDGPKDPVKQGLEDQSKQVDSLMDRIRQTVQDAEETEPLLAKGLFETVRKAAEQAIPGALKQAQRLADAGINTEAARSSRQAGQGIEQIRQGVEKAAQGVLGDETAALKRAQGELDDLANQVNREIARAGGPEPTGRESQGQQSRPGDPDGADPQKPGGGGSLANPGPDGEDRPPGVRGRTPATPTGQDQQGQQPGQSQQGQQPGRGQQEGAPGDQQGQQPGQGKQPGQQPGQGNQPGEQPGPGQQGGQPGQQPGQGNPPGQQPGPQGGGQGQGQQGGQGNQPGQHPGEPGQQPGVRGNRPGQQPGGGGGPGGRMTGLDRMLEGLNGGGVGPGGPITGEGFRQWSDRMRDVEDLLQDPQLRSDAARIRDRVRGAREEFKRHSVAPAPQRLKALVADPIRELRDRVAEEVRRRESPDSLVPIDRDPVPPQYAEGVRRYYERLGSGR